MYILSSGMPIHRGGLGDFLCRSSSLSRPLIGISGDVIQKSIFQGIHVGGVVGPSSDKVVAARQDKLPVKSGIPVRGEQVSPYIPM